MAAARARLPSSVSAVPFDAPVIAFGTITMDCGRRLALEFGERARQGPETHSAASVS